MAQGGAGAAPVFTEIRIEALRNHLRALMKALKAGYSEATAAGATQKQREDANLLVGSFTKALEEVEDEYRTSVVTTDDVDGIECDRGEKRRVFRAATTPANNPENAEDARKSEDPGSSISAGAGNEHLHINDSVNRRRRRENEIYSRN